MTNLTGWPQIEINEKPLKSDPVDHVSISPVTFSVFSRKFIARTCVRFHEWLTWRLRISPCNSSSHTFHSNEISEAKVLFALIKNHHILAIFQIPICFMETAQPVSVYTVFRRLVRCVCARQVSEPAGRSVSWRQWKPWTFKEYSS